MPSQLAQPAAPAPAPAASPEQPAADTLPECGGQCGAAAYRAAARRAGRGRGRADVGCRGHARRAARRRGVGRRRGRRRRDAPEHVRAAALDAQRQARATRRRREQACGAAGGRARVPDAAHRDPAPGRGRICAAAELIAELSRILWPRPRAEAHRAAEAPTTPDARRASPPTLTAPTPTPAALPRSFSIARRSVIASSARACPSRHRRLPIYSRRASIALSRARPYVYLHAQQCTYVYVSTPD